MTEPTDLQPINRRGLLRAGLAVAALSVVPLSLVPLSAGRWSTGSARAAAPQSLSPAMRARALAALDRHRAVIGLADVIGIADFAQPSARPRFHLLDLASGHVETLLVAHGRGSDPEHSGWLQHFSNIDGSYASSAGAYVSCDVYIGKHGRSLRLDGLDGSNNNALARAIVVHAAWYVSQEMARDTGKLGRSEGCFAVEQASLDQVLARLGNGRMIYADKV